ncbi:hypothetical protein BH11CYA1_BH11CYA1_43890 [soil metagenome]
MHYGLKQSQLSKLFLALTLISLTTTACSQQSQELSEREKDIDKQKDVQIKVVERTTEELKESVDRQKEQNLQAIEVSKKQLDIEKDNLDAQSKEVKDSTKFAKENLDQQKDESKKIVDRNAQVAKDELKDMARSRK